MIKDPILDRFHHLASRRPEAPLFVAAHRRSTAEEVHRLSVQITQAVRAAGIERESLVGLAVGNGPGFAAGYLGLRSAGCRVLLLDTRTPDDERKRIHTTLGSAGELLSNDGWPRAAHDIEVRAAACGESAPSLDDRISTVRLTSGSSGMPRGIAHTSEALLADDRALRATMGLTDERVLASVPLSHAYGFASIFLPCITLGWTVSTPEGLSPFAAIEATHLGEVTFLPTVPAYLQALLKMAEPPPLPESVRLVITAGAPLRPETADAFFRTYRRHVHVFYGASEVGGITYDRSGTAGLRASLGAPVDGVTVRLEPVPGVESSAGIVTVESPAAAEMHFPKPDTTLGNGRFRTSDLGRFEGGELRLLGRIDSMINVRGKKVNPKEIESVLEAMPGVDESIVRGIPPAPGEDASIAALVAVSSRDVRAEQVKGWCANRLSAHKTPRIIRLVETIPRTARGKVDRRQVEQLLKGNEPLT